MNALLGGLVGLVIALVAQRPIRQLPLGIHERQPQPDWTWRTTHPVLVAVGAAGLGVLLGTTISEGTAFALALVLLAVAIPAAVIDLRWRVVPDTLVVLGSAAAVAVLALRAPGLLPSHLIIGAGAGAGIGVVAAASRGALGLGDAKLVAVFGLLLGWTLPLALLLGTLLAGLAAPLVLLVRGRRATVPLVPFLAAGALGAAVISGTAVPGG